MKCIFLAMLMLAVTSTAIAEVYECKNQFGGKTFTNVPRLAQWYCTDPTLPGYDELLGYSIEKEKVNDKCSPQKLSSCVILEYDPLTNEVTARLHFISLTCVLLSSIAPNYHATSIRVLYNEGNNEAIVNGHKANHVSITDNTLSFHWLSDARIVIDRYTGRFRMGTTQDPALAAGQCERVKRRKF